VVGWGVCCHCRGGCYRASKGEKIQVVSGGIGTTTDRKNEAREQVSMVLAGRQNRVLGRAKSEKGRGVKPYRWGVFAIPRKKKSKTWGEEGLRGI